MSKIIKVIDEEMDHPLDYRIVDSGRGNDIKRFVPEPGTNNLDNATPVDRNLLEQIQKNGVYEVETVHTVNSSSLDIYNCDIEGLNDFGIYEKLLIKMFVDMPNEFDQPKIKLNDIEYTMLYKPENEDFKPLNAGMLKAGQFYNLVFNGSQFIIENGSLPATPDNEGIISLNKIRGTEIAYALGAEYGGVFGSDLTNIEVGKNYYYCNTNICTPYKALRNSTNSSGFITPDISNFVEISNANNANIVYSDGPYTLTFNVKESILYIHNDVSSPMYSISTLANTINKFCTQYSYNIPTGAFLAGFKAWKIASPTGVLDCYGIRSSLGTWGFYAGETNINISPADYYVHSGNAHVKLLKS